MTKVRVKFEGGKELEKALGQLSSQVTRKNVARRALKAAAEPIRDAAKAKVPVDTGRLREAIGVRNKRRSTAFRELAYLSFRTFGDIRMAKGFSDKSVEVEVAVYGSPSRNKRTGKRTGLLVYAEVQERGNEVMPAQPFMRPAWDSQGGMTALNRILAALRIEIDKAVARAARRALRPKK
ncbi:HK97-gp10 family putative phage morphogenesis protein [Erythrobacter sp. NE805]|uniref:HK97-gp10 family putative phage morphogenesis protein n=1 Tax=Erythrobacter sp. NE805 TaxID=3389875 RepID=UPI00396B24F8